MNVYRSRPNVVSAVALALSVLIAIAILGAIAALFDSRGIPLEELAAAERACSERSYVSERDACMHDWLAANGVRVARERAGGPSLARRPQRFGGT
jgi:hypothetical protein